MKLKVILCFSFLGLCFINFCQAPINDDCSNAIFLCYDDDTSGSNINATLDTCSNCSDWDSTSLWLQTTQQGLDTVYYDSSLCFQLNNSVWYKFRTNDDGGDINITINNITCSGDTNSDFSNELQAAVIKPNIDCDYTSYELVSSCVSGSDEIQLPCYGLGRDYVYYIVVDGGNLNNGTLTSSAECGFRISINGAGVNPSVSAGNDLWTNSNEGIELQGESLLYGNSLWYPNEYLNDSSILKPIATINETTEFELTFTQYSGCSYTDAVTVYIEKPLVVYNTITPNGDGINDKWVIENIDSYIACEINIFDRWGQQVFYSIGYPDSKHWMGDFKGNALPEGVYYYVIDTKSQINQTIYNGVINLLR